jgi:hypothetical protein
MSGPGLRLIVNRVYAATDQFPEVQIVDNNLPFFAAVDVHSVFDVTKESTVFTLLVLVQNMTTSTTRFELGKHGSVGAASLEPDAWRTQDRTFFFPIAPLDAGPANVVYRITALLYEGPTIIGKFPPPLSSAQSDLILATSFGVN